MSESMNHLSQPEYRDSGYGTGRIAVSAWVIVAFVILLFAGVQALASLHGVSPRQASLTGAFVPRHDPDCAGPRIPNAAAGDQCRGLGAPFAQTVADAYAHTGW
jgi:hypothetical protein